MSHRHHRHPAASAAGLRPLELAPTRWDRAQRRVLRWETLRVRLRPVVLAAFAGAGLLAGWEPTVALAIALSAMLAYLVGTTGRFAAARCMTHAAHELEATQRPFHLCHDARSAA